MLKLGFLKWDGQGMTQAADTPDNKERLRKHEYGVGEM